MKVINIYLKRKFLTKESTTGDFFCKDLGFHYASIEDPVRDVKIPKLTAFPEGVYELGLRDFNEDRPDLYSFKTKQYQKRFDWFKWHIWIKDVPNYNYVYIHIGNTHEDTDGCVLLGMSRSKNKVNSSVDAFHSFYEKIYPYLEDEDTKVCLHVENCY
jgi:hypothetical protein